MSIEKKIADALIRFFGKGKRVETAVVAEVKKVEKFVVSEAKDAFERAHNNAVAANKEVNAIKASLQDALARATELHRAAVDGAQAAQAVAEADVARFKALAVAHLTDLETQASQIVTPVTTADSSSPQQ
jgi:uncharacterized protein involved in exopolysaccharide biosynthesis